MRTRNPAQYNTAPYYTPQPVYYGNTYTANNGISSQIYYYSQAYISGYTYYSTPTPGYYYYLPVRNTNVSVQSAYINQNNRYYTPQNYVVGTPNTQVYSNGQYYYPNNYPYTTTVSSYPGCSKANILI